MRKVLLIVSAVAMAQLANSQTAAPKRSPTTARRPAARPAAKPAAPMTDDQKIIYSLGLSMYRQLAQFNLSPAELDLLKKGLSDAAAGKPAVDLNTWGPKIQGFVQARAARGAELEKTSSKAYLAKAAAVPGAMKTDSGLIYRELRAGTGDSPKPTDTVKVNYRGTLVNGTEFDSSYKRNEAAEFPLDHVIKCWTEGVQKMKVGGKAQLVCPSELAYGDRGQPGIPPGATLIFEVELLSISNAPAAK